MKHSKKKLGAKAREEVVIEKKTRSESLRNHERIGNKARAHAKAISSRGTGKVKKLKRKTGKKLRVKV